MPGGLLTDLYELNMAVSYLRRGMTGRATFSLFVRRLPPGRGFLITVGLEDCLAFLEQFAFTAADLEWLAGSQGFGERDLEVLRRLQFTGEVWAVPEGTAVFAGEPLVEVTAPIPEAQLAETGPATGSTTPACRTPGSSPAAVSTSTPLPPWQRPAPRPDRPELSTDRVSSDHAPLIVTLAPDG